MERRSRADSARVRRLPGRQHTRLRDRRRVCDTPAAPNRTRRATPSARLRRHAAELPLPARWRAHLVDQWAGGSAGPACRRQRVPHPHAADVTGTRSVRRRHVARRASPHPPESTLALSDAKVEPNVRSRPDRAGRPGELGSRFRFRVNRTVPVERPFGCPLRSSDPAFVRLSGPLLLVCHRSSAVATSDRRARSWPIDSCGSRRRPRAARTDYDGRRRSPAT